MLPIENLSRPVPIQGSRMRPRHVFCTAAMALPYLLAGVGALLQFGAHGGAESSGKLALLLAIFVAFAVLVGAAIFQAVGTLSKRHATRLDWVLLVAMWLALSPFLFAVLS